MKSVGQRRDHIVKDLAQRGSVEVRALAESLGVAQMTIRRDLEVLEHKGLLHRTHGGAVARERVAYEFSFREKAARHEEEKQRIGRAAAALARKGETVFLDTGTTALEIGRCLRSAEPGVIVTHNLCIVSEYLYQREVRVLVPGGELNPISPDLYGEWTYTALRNLSVDVAFLGADAVDPAEGFYTPDLKSATVGQIMLERSGRAILAADSSKFGRRSRFKSGDLKSLTAVVTDRGLPVQIRKILKARGIRVVFA